ncbi:uncharacterized protein [Diadema setosum]|uniref:uncharacterized protein n=1 Tax=Diadema setosum TaxID=31175 RepID=UPI003B3ACD73
MSSHTDGGSPTMSSIFRRIPSVRERARRGSLGQVSGGAAIHDAVAKGKIHLAKFILDAVESHNVVNSRDAHGKTPLIRAAKLDDSETRMKATNLLIKHGANVNHKDNMGRTALSYAAEMQYNDVIKALVKNNVDPNLVDNNGNTPLVYCASVGNAAGIAILTKSFRRLGLDVDKLNAEGMSALLIAAKGGFMECVKLLTHEGKASLEQRDQIRNMTAAEWARESGCSTPDMEVFLPKIRRQSKPTETSPSSAGAEEEQSKIHKHESFESNCSSSDGCSPRRTTKNSSTEEVFPRQESQSGQIAVPTPPTYRKNPQPHIEVLSRRFHALHPIKDIHDISSMKQHFKDNKRASLPEVTTSEILCCHDDEQDLCARDSTSRPVSAAFVKRTKPSAITVQRRPLSAINRRSNHRQSKSFDGATYQHSSNSAEELRPEEHISKSLSMNYLANPTAKNLLNLTFLSRSTETLSPIPCKSDTCPDQASLRISINSTTQINVDIDPHRKDTPSSDQMLKVEMNGQSDLTPRLPPLSPKRVLKGL